MSTRKRLAKALPALHEDDDATLLRLIPIDEVERVIWRPLLWSVLKSRDAIRAADISAYNTISYVDIHRRLLHLPHDHRHPLATRGTFADWGHDPTFAETIGSRHNQIYVRGELDGVSPIELQLAAVYDDSLLLNDLALMNPLAQWQRPPLELGQIGPGIGNGICAEVIRRLSAYGLSKGLTCIRAYAADHVRASIFMKHGFAIDESDTIILRASAVNGIQVPIWKRL